MRAPAPATKPSRTRPYRSLAARGGMSEVQLQIDAHGTGWGRYLRLEYAAEALDGALLDAQDAVAIGEIVPVQRHIVMIEPHTDGGLKGTVGGSDIPVGESGRYGTQVRPVQMQITGVLREAARVLAGQINFLLGYIGHRIDGLHGACGLKGRGDRL